MSSYTAWIGMSETFKVEMFQFIKNGTPATEFPAINDLDEKTVNFFAGIHEEGAYERIFKPWVTGGGSKTFKLWGFNSGKPDGTQVIKKDLDMLIAAYPTNFAVMGAWVIATGEPVGGVDNPWYPSPPELLNFMSDTFVPGPDPENPEEGGTWLPATEVTDVTGLIAQAPRMFI